MENQDDAYGRDGELYREEQHLEDVVASIDLALQWRENLGPITAGTGKAADKVKAMMDIGTEELWKHRSSPYFGRVDYSTDADEDAKTIYIGEYNVQNEDPRYQIVSRNAPVASLYYRPMDGYYKAPRGQIGASVHLKRTLTIEDAQLLDFDDVLRLPQGRVADPSTSSRVLDSKLSSAMGQHLSDAVQTIQPEQYAQIAATLDQVLIVQGAAGSGKSLVGLHRIDFILSPFSDIGRPNRPTAERVIMFGPSPAFLQYVSGLLTGIEGVGQTTVTRWMVSQFSSRVVLSTRDRTFTDLMNNRRKPTDSENEAYLFKTGVKMKRVVDKYVARLKRGILENISGNIHVEGTRTGSPLRIGAGALRRLAVDAVRAHKEPNVARGFLVRNLAEEWARLNPRPGITRTELLAEAAALVEASLSPIWPRIDFRDEYLTLVSFPDTIMAYARKGDVDLAGAEAIARTAPEGRGRALGLTDLAAALYLDYSINGFQSQRFEHVFVDEAQDVSPLEIVLMQMHSTNNSFSIMGDLRQGVLRYKSIANWNQIASLFRSESVSRLESRIAYRSTRQITQYANRILQGLPERTKMPKPYSRDGTLPRLVRSKSASEMRSSIAESVRRLLDLDDVNRVAVLTKWEETAGTLHRFLEDAGSRSVDLLTQDGVVEADVTVSPILLTKGLEFDAVIVANAHKDNFYESEFDRLLLYLACTRARNHLEIHWYGSRSAIVPDTARLASGTSRSL